MKATTLQEEGTNSSLRGSVKLLTLGLAGHIRYSSGVLKASYFSNTIVGVGQVQLLILGMLF